MSALKYRYLVSLDKKPLTASSYSHSDNAPHAVSKHIEDFIFSEFHYFIQLCHYLHSHPPLGFHSSVIQCHLNKYRSPLVQTSFTFRNCEVTLDLVHTSPPNAGGPQPDPSLRTHYSLVHQPFAQKAVHRSNMSQKGGTSCKRVKKNNNTAPK